MSISDIDLHAEQAAMFNADPSMANVKDKGLLHAALLGWLAARRTPIKKDGPAVHPGEHLKSQYMVPGDFTSHELGQLLETGRTVIADIVSKKKPMSADVALRLEYVFGSPADEWLSMQARYDLEQAKLENDYSTLASYINRTT